MMYNIIINKEAEQTEKGAKNRRENGSEIIRKPTKPTDKKIALAPKF